MADFPVQVSGSTRFMAPRARFSGAHLIINRSFGLLWGGQAVSAIGDTLFRTTLILWIGAGIAAHRTWAPLAVSGVFIADTLPVILIGPLAGVFVDRWDKRRTMLSMDAIRAALILLLTLTAGLLRLPTWASLSTIYLAVGAATICTQFFGPARLALLNDVVAAPNLTRASSRQQVTGNLSLIIGPALAAPIFFGLGARWALIFDALTFAISFLAIILLRDVPSSAQGVAQQRSFRRDLSAGLHFFAGNRVLMTLLISLALVMLGYGAITTLNIFFLQQNLHAAAHWFGVFSVVSGIGAIVGTVLVGFLASRLAPLRTLWVSLLILGMLDLMYARLSSLPPALVVLFLMGLPAAACNITLMPIVLLVTPRAFIGRVVAVIVPAMSIASIISVALAGYLVSTLLRGLHATFLGVTFGPIDTIFTATGLLELASGIYAMLAFRGAVLGSIAVPDPNVQATSTIESPPATA
jgi:predicted MFS family arabinose efflux permease